MKSTSQLLKAFSEETRLRIINLLSAGELCVCDLMAILDLPQSTVSRHLAYLRNTGLVVDRRQGVWMHYRLATDLTEFQQNLMQLIQAEISRRPQGKQDRSSLEQRGAEAQQGCSQSAGEL